MEDLNFAFVVILYMTYHCYNLSSSCSQTISYLMRYVHVTMYECPYTQIVLIIKVMEGHHRNDNLIEDFCDAQAYKAHHLFSNDPTSLQIMLYYDDLEICNPIGSHSTKHKIGKYDYYVITIGMCFSGIFYYLLGNISSQYRSCLKFIQLLAIVKHSYLKSYGINKILEPFMNDIRALESVCILILYIVSYIVFIG